MRDGLSALPSFWNWFPGPVAQTGMNSRLWHLEIGVVRAAFGSTESRPTDLSLHQVVTSELQRWEGTLLFGTYHRWCLEAGAIDIGAGLANCPGL